MTFRGARGGDPGVSDGAVIEHLQAHASLSPGIAFSGGTASSDRCVASGSGGAGGAGLRTARRA